MLYCICAFSPGSKENYENVLRDFAVHPPKFFTFNDGFGEKPPRSVEFMFQELLPTMFPQPSQYELAGAP